MAQKIKLILLDLDGTLLTRAKTISPRNYAALERCAKAGIHIVPSTGRFYEGMPEVVRALPFVRYVVAVNGAQVYDVKEDNVLCRAEIPPEQAAEVFRELDTLPVIYDCYQNNWGYMSERLYARIDEFITEPAVKRMVKELRRPVPDLTDYILSGQHSVQKIQMFFADMNRRAAELQRLPRVFPTLAVSSAITNNIEINAQKANKGEALRFLCRHLNLSTAEAMAMGDGTNDLSMIKVAGVGVAMAAADPALLTAADFITADAEEDGVARAIERFCFHEVE